MKHKIYLSGPLFSRGEVAWGRKLKAFLEDRLVNAEIIWPHEIIPCTAGPRQIFQANVQALNDCDLMVAILDGPQVDDGTAWGVGYFFMQSKMILGIRTDFRRAGESVGSKVNLMVESSCQAIASSLDELVSALSGRLD
ncbi:Nucleoside 2-deoxyribosyltransferase [uncultured archaeon]|nr:Nucleoside 2-deoxyribosyltransferase [uncultured archaeon]